MAPALAALALLAGLSACGGLVEDEAAPPTSRTTSAPAAPPSTPAPSSTGTPSAPATPETPPTPAGPTPSDGTPRDALLSIPALDIVDLPVDTYAGFTDDAAGTEIQDGGIAASPHGPQGGTGPGGVGNYQVTAHRLSSTRAFEFLPDLVDGDVALVEVGELTLSTCRTPEDRAEGNYWSDEFGNPEHRIDKIGRLVDVVPST